jgi:hypothetical protein
MSNRYLMETPRLTLRPHGFAPGSEEPAHEAPHRKICGANPQSTRVDKRLDRDAQFQ